MGDAPTPRDVFISYASQDKAVADAACQALEQAGIPCWIAPRDVSPGEFYADAIVRALNEASILLLMLTNDAVASPHVLREVERTSAKRHAIVTLRFTSVSLTPALEYFLSASHWLDASESDSGSTMSKLVVAVQRLMAPPNLGSPGKPVTDLFHLSLEARRSPLKTYILIGVIVAIAAVVAYLVVDKVRLASARRASPPAVMASEPGASAAAGIPAAENSIAVLPFADMSERKDQEYFSDGLSEELIDRLARIPDLAVPGRTSSFYFKGKQATIAEIAKTLSVTHILEGSVRKSGDRLRVTVQLIRADNGYHLWSETYDRKLDDIFKIQDDISALVIKALKLALSPVAAATANPNVDANDLYMRAKFIYGGLTKDSTASTIVLLKQALALDPRFARAWALLARARSHQAWQPEESSLTEVAGDISEARDAAERAVSLAPTIADGHLALGRIYLNADRNIGKASEEFERAIRLEPRNSDALLQRSAIAEHERRFDAAAREAEAALALDPLNPNVMTVLGDEYLALGDGASAERVARKVSELYPANMFWETQLVNALALQGRAREAYDFAEVQAQNEYEHLWDQAFYLPSLGRPAEADAALVRLEAAEPRKLAPFAIAEVYAHRGDKDRTFEWLNRQFKLDPRPLEFLDRDPWFVGMRDDERFKDLRRRLNLPPLVVPGSPAH
jgi:TolB-like protein/cytochrome c-type biogenesis protein CcmH/NrfG